MTEVTRVSPFRNVGCPTSLCGAARRPAIKRRWRMPRDDVVVGLVELRTLSSLAVAKGGSRPTGSITKADAAVQDPSSVVQSNW